jgi:hypothetical protein
VRPLHRVGEIEHHQHAMATSADSAFAHRSRQYLVVASDVPHGGRTIYAEEGGKYGPFLGQNTWNVCVGGPGIIPVEIPLAQITPLGDPYAAPGTFLCDFDPTPTQDKPNGRCTTIYWMDDVTDVPRPFGDIGAYKKQGGPDDPEDNGVLHLSLDQNDPITKYIHGNKGAVIRTVAQQSATCVRTGKSPGFPCKDSDNSCELPPQLQGTACKCTFSLLSGSCSWDERTSDEAPAWLVSPPSGLTGFARPANPARATPYADRIKSIYDKSPVYRPRFLGHLIEPYAGLATG